MRPDLPSDERGDEDYPHRYRRAFDPRRPYSRDEDHLRILSILYYIFGALSAFYCSIPLIHVTIGALLVSGVIPNHGPEDAIVGWCFVGIGGTIVLAGWVLAACILYAGYCLARRQRYMYCFVIAAVSCAQVPLGTVLGVFTIIVLVRPTVKELFEQGKSDPPAAES